jgi:hypothetical protein
MLEVAPTGSTCSPTAGHSPESAMTASSPASDPIAVASLRPVLPGLCLSALTLLFGFGLGIVFGLNETLIKARLAAAADAAPQAVYQQDAAAKAAILDKSWTYMQRAHLHAGAMGTTAIALTLVLVLLGTTPRLARPLSLALGVGGLGYAAFWMWAGFRAPGLGSTGAAKESLKWLAMPSSGIFVLATATVALLLLRASRQGRRMP